jgi:hypothetical protein
LVRIGCFAGGTDGNLNPATKAAIKRYQTGRGQAEAEIEITQEFVAELMGQVARVCPLVCPTGQVAEGERCIAVQKPVPVAKQRDEQEDRRPRAKEETRTRPVARQRDEDERPARRREESKPRVRQEASSSRYSGGGGRYSGGGGGGGGGGHGPIGVGF